MSKPTPAPSSAPPTPAPIRCWPTATATARAIGMRSPPPSPTRTAPPRSPTFPIRCPIRTPRPAPPTSRSRFTSCPASPTWSAWAMSAGTAPGLSTRSPNGRTSSRTCSTASNGWTTRNDVRYRGVITATGNAQLTVGRRLASHDRPGTGLRPCHGLLSRRTGAAHQVLPGQPQPRSGISCRRAARGSTTPTATPMPATGIAPTPGRPARQPVALSAGMPASNTTISSWPRRHGRSTLGRTRTWLPARLSRSATTGVIYTSKSAHTSSRELGAGRRRASRHLLERLLGLST